MEGNSTDNRDKISLEKEEGLTESVQNSSADNSSDSDLFPSQQQEAGMFKRLFSFNGRIRRTEYGLSYIVYIIWYALMRINNSTQDPDLLFSLILLAAAIPVYWLVLAQGAKRCHDVGRNGWWQLIPFYPLYLIFGEGVQGSNEYGPDPKR